METVWEMQILKQPWELGKAMEIKISMKMVILSQNSLKLATPTILLERWI